MIETIAATAAVLMIAVTAMAIGAIAGRRSLQGSCGGIPGSACKCSKARRAACEQEPGVAKGPSDPASDLVDVSRLSR